MSDEGNDPQPAGEIWSGRRVGLIIGALALSLCALGYLVYYAFSQHAKPSDVAVPTILFIGLGALVVLLAPWRDLGLIPTEIAGVKFERIVNAQKKEQIEAIVPLQEELRDLKAKYDLLSSMIVAHPDLHEEVSKRFNEEGFRPSSVQLAGDVHKQRQDALTEILSKFLRAHRGSFFSPIRIQNWGGGQKGYEELRKFSTDEIRDFLFKGVQDGTLDTTISRRGNTLYGISRKNDRA